MKELFKPSVFTISIAIFSMFFGAGNIVFPLQLGMENQGQYLFSFLGLFITAICGPLLGILAATVVQGSCKKVYCSAGKKLGIFLMILTLSMGPIIVLPRCLTVAYGAFGTHFSLSLGYFAIIFSLISLLCCWKHRYILPILGNVLSPVLLLCLLIIIYQSFQHGSPLTSGPPALEAFKSGLITGYYTMDLIASIYFSTGIWMLIQKRFKSDVKTTFKITLVSGAIGCLFLAVIYLGLSFSAASFYAELQNIAPEKLLSHLAILTLGPKFAIISNVAVTLACLTTVISFTMATSDIICKDLLNNKLSYHSVIILNLLIATVMSQMGFTGLMDILIPIISICYPVIILLVMKCIAENLGIKNRFLSTRKP